MARPALRLQDVTFSYESSPANLFEDLSIHVPTGWTGVVGVNGAGKTPLLLLASGVLEPTRGSVVATGSRIYCEQRTDFPPEDLYEFLASTDATAHELSGRFGLAPDWVLRWETLSHGERKRAQIATALWREPDVLALDEPTNHIDGRTRDQLVEGLRSYAGVGLLVSHDRELLDGLCERTIVIEEGRATVRPGGYSRATELVESERDSTRRAHETLQREVRRLQNVASDRRREADRADRMRSGKHLDPKDKDGRGRLRLAILTGKDGKAGRLLDQLSGRLEKSREKLGQTRVTKESTLGVELRGEPCRRDLLFRMPAATISMGTNRRLIHPDLLMSPLDRVALTGPNGAGKSTLVNQILSGIELGPDRVVFMPQEIDRKTGASVLRDIRKLGHERLGELMTYVSRLGSRPERLLTTEQPSPGELRKLLLSLGITRRPHLIVLDEPTNHLDLPSIECLEEALSACRCGLLLVSHDRVFLRKLTTTWWDLLDDGPGRQSLVIGSANDL